MRVGLATWLVALLHVLVAHALTNAKFSNCVPDGDDTPVPLFLASSVQAGYSEPDHQGNRTLEFRITGTLTNGTLVDLNTKTNEYTTLRVTSNILNYDLHNSYAQFCKHVEEPCPWNESTEGIFTYQFNISEGYQAVSYDTTFYIVDPSETTVVIGCIAVEVSPVLASYVWYPLTFGILIVVLLLVIAYYLATLFNPWSKTSNIYLSSTNYNSSVDTIRLITPGISDYLYYVQFAFFTGCLSLDYPGFFRSILATVSWSCLLFHFSWVSKQTQHFDDNLYIYEGKYGMSHMARDVQLSQDSDIWPGFIVWLLVAVACTLGMSGIVLTIHHVIKKKNQAASLTSLSSSSTAINMDQHISYDAKRTSAAVDNTPAELSVPGQKPLYFLFGMTVRLILRVFAFPLVSVGFFQIYIINRYGSPYQSDIFSVITILAWIALASYGTYVTVIRSFHHLGELRTKLIWGSLYNIYPLSERPFYVAVELSAKFLQGLAIGLVQRSGLGQLIILIVIEIVLFFAVTICHPFETGTFMNIISASLNVMKMVILCLMIPFVNELNTSEAVKGWLGYVILVFHGVVVLLFLVHAIRVFVELLLRRGRIPLAESPNTTNLNGGATVGSPDAKSSYEMNRLTLVDEANDEFGDEKKYTAVGSRNYYRNPRDTLNPPRESIFEEAFASSPTSDMVSPVSAGGTTQNGSIGYYRRPRRRQSSHDWAIDQGNASTSGKHHSRKYKSDEHTLISDEGDEEFNFGADSPAKVNYAIREADMYITKRGSAASWLNDEVEGSAIMKRTSRVRSGTELLLYDEMDDEETEGLAATRAMTEPSQEVYGATSNGNKNSTMGKLFGKIKSLRGPRRKEEVESSSGFEVLSRPRIVPVKYHPAVNTGDPPSSSTANFSSIAAGSDSEEMIAEDHVQSQDGASASETRPLFYAPQISKPTGLRVVTDDLDGRGSVLSKMSSVYESALSDEE